MRFLPRPVIPRIGWSYTGAREAWDYALRLDLMPVMRRDLFDENPVIVQLNARRRQQMLRHQQRRIRR